jgi:hypothetical protein
MRCDGANADAPAAALTRGRRGALGGLRLNLGANAEATLRVAWRGEQPRARQLSEGRVHAVSRTSTQNLSFLSLAVPHTMQTRNSTSGRSRGMPQFTQKLNTTLGCRSLQYAQKRSRRFSHSISGRDASSSSESESSPDCAAAGACAGLAGSGGAPALPCGCAPGAGSGVKEEGAGGAGGADMTRSAAGLTGPPLAPATTTGTAGRGGQSPVRGGTGGGGREGAGLLADASPAGLAGPAVGRCCAEAGSGGGARLGAYILACASASDRRSVLGRVEPAGSDI